MHEPRKSTKQARATKVKQASKQRKIISLASWSQTRPSKLNTRYSTKRHRKASFGWVSGVQPRERRKSIKQTKSNLASKANQSKQASKRASERSSKWASEQPTKQPSNQLTNQPINHVSKHECKQLTNQSTNQPSNQPINQASKQASK